MNFISTQHLTQSLGWLPPWCVVCYFPATGCAKKWVGSRLMSPGLPPASRQRPLRRRWHRSTVCRCRPLNLRACPGMDCPRIILLTRNQEVEKVGESQGWFQVRSRQDGTLGWVDARYLGSAPVADSVALPSETVQPKQTKSVEAKPKVKTPVPVVEEEEEEKPRPKRRRAPCGRSRRTTHPTRGRSLPRRHRLLRTPAAPSESGKKKIRIM